MNISKIAQPVLALFRGLLFSKRNTNLLYLLLGILSVGINNSFAEEPEITDEPLYKIKSISVTNVSSNGKDLIYRLVIENFKKPLDISKLLQASENRKQQIIIINDGSNIPVSCVSLPSDPLKIKQYCVFTLPSTNTKSITVKGIGGTYITTSSSLKKTTYQYHDQTDQLPKRLKLGINEPELKMDIKAIKGSSAAYEINAHFPEHKHRHLFTYSIGTHKNLFKITRKANPFVGHFTKGTKEAAITVTATLKPQFNRFTNIKSSYTKTIRVHHCPENQCDSAVEIDQFTVVATEGAADSLSYNLAPDKIKVSTSSFAKPKSYQMSCTRALAKSQSTKAILFNPKADKPSLTVDLGMQQKCSASVEFDAPESTDQHRFFGTKEAGSLTFHPVASAQVTVGIPSQKNPPLKAGEDISQYLWIKPSIKGIETIISAKSEFKEKEQVLGSKQKQPYKNTLTLNRSGSKAVRTFTYEQPITQISYIDLNGSPIIEVRFTQGLPLFFKLEENEFTKYDRDKIKLQRAKVPGATIIAVAISESQIIHLAIDNQRARNLNNQNPNRLFVASNAESPDNSAPKPLLEYKDYTILDVSIRRGEKPELIVLLQPQSVNTQETIRIESYNIAVNNQGITLGGSVVKERKTQHSYKSPLNQYGNFCRRITWDKDKVKLQAEGYCLLAYHPETEEPIVQKTSDNAFYKMSAAGALAPLTLGAFKDILADGAVAAGLDAGMTLAESTAMLIAGVSILEILQSNQSKSKDKKPNSSGESDPDKDNAKKLADKINDLAGEASKKVHSIPELMKGLSSLGIGVRKTPCFCEKQPPSSPEEKYSSKPIVQAAQTDSSSMRYSYAVNINPYVLTIKPISEAQDWLISIQHKDELWGLTLAPTQAILAKLALLVEPKELSKLKQWFTKIADLHSSMLMREFVLEALKKTFQEVRPAKNPPYLFKQTGPNLLSDNLQPSPLLDDLQALQTNIDSLTTPINNAIKSLLSATYAPNKRLIEAFGDKKITSLINHLHNFSLSKTLPGPIEALIKQLDISEPANMLHSLNQLYAAIERYLERILNSSPLSQSQKNNKVDLSTQLYQSGCLAVAKGFPTAKEQRSLPNIFR